jgi:hypothetical protein
MTPRQLAGRSPEVDTVMDSEDKVQRPITSTAIAPIAISPESTTELKSIIVFTSFHVPAAGVRTARARTGWPYFSQHGPSYPTAILLATAADGG